MSISDWFSLDNLLHGGKVSYTSPVTPAPAVPPPEFHNQDQFNKYLPAIKSAEDSVSKSTGVDVHGVVPSLMSKESSLGLDSSGQNPVNGQYGWLMGMTQTGVKELQRNGVKNVDLDSPQGVFTAAATLYALKRKNNTDISPGQTYQKYYYGGPDQRTAPEFDQRYDYYNNLKY